MKRLGVLSLIVTAATVFAAPEAQMGGALRHGTDYEISVLYTGPVDTGSLGNPENYVVSPGALDTLRLAATNQGAILTVSGLNAGQPGTVSIANILDTGGNPVPDAMLQFTTSDRLWTAIGANELGFRADVLTVTNGGYDLFNGGIQQSADYDEATFVGQSVTGNFDVKVRVEYVDPAGFSEKAGIIVREQLDEGKSRPLDPEDPTQAFSRYLELAVTSPASLSGEESTNHQIWQRSTPTFITTALTVTNDAAPAFPKAWLRIQRVGQQFSLFRGVDGSNWQQIGGATFDPPLSNTVYVGLAFSPQNDEVAPDDRKAFVAKFRDYDLQALESPPELKIQFVDATHAEILFTSGWTLQTAPTVLGDWTDLPTATSPYRVDVTTDTKRFYRLKK